MHILVPVLLVLAFVLTLLAAWLNPNPPRVHLGWLGVSAAMLAAVIMFWPK